MRVIPVGVDEHDFPLGRSEGRSRNSVLFVGFINRNKGIDVLLRAVSMLVARGRPVRLKLAGGAFYRGTRLEEERVRALAQSLELSDHVEFLGIRAPIEVAALMRESSVLVLPSRAESFGAVLVEALASGTPVVATRCGGPEDIVTDEVGRLVEPEDPRALANAIADVLSNSDSYRPEDLRAYALSRFSLQSVADRIRAEYLAALSGPPKGVSPRFASPVDAPA
jgi:glycosyltransferase involved in cell wall biosynthesis